MSSLEETITANLHAVKQRIADAAARSDRTADDVKLVAVTKYAQDEWTECLAGLHPIFGESRPQQLAARSGQFDSNIEWHLIGQLQRNKVRPILPLCHTIHSVDSWRLLDRIELLAAELELKPRVLLEVNVSGEESKAGFQPNQLTTEFERISKFDHTQVTGLMTMAPAGDAESTRGYFAQLRELAEKLRPATGLPLPELSMGMSGDFEVAIEEGATIVRVGSRLFDGLGYRQ